MAKKDQKEGPPRCYSCLTAPRHQRMRGHLLHLGGTARRPFLQEWSSTHWTVTLLPCGWTESDMEHWRPRWQTVWKSYRILLLAEFKTLRGETEGRKSWNSFEIRNPLHCGARVEAWKLMKWNVFALTKCNPPRARFKRILDILSSMRNQSFNSQDSGRECGRVFFGWGEGPPLMASFKHTIGRGGSNPPTHPF